MSIQPQTKTEAFGGWLIAFILFWPLFGWLGDLSIEERDQQNVFEKAATWTSVFFHVGGAVTISLFFPLWGIFWGIFAAVILARRLGARKGLALSLRSMTSYLNVRVAGAGAAVAVLQPVLNYWTVLGAMGVLTVIVAFAVAATQCTTSTLAENALYLRWANRLKNIFEVPEAVFLEQAGLASYGTGLVIGPVPDDVRKKFATLGVAGIDANLVAVDPNLELAPESTNERIVIQAASKETVERRAALQESGGLFTGIGIETVSLADVAVSTPHPHAAPQEQGEPLVISLEDL